MLRSDIPVSLPLHLFVDYDDAQGVDCDQAPADVGVFTVPFKCGVLRAQAHITEDCGGTATTPVVKFDKRDTAGTNTGRGDGDIANLVLSTTAAGKAMYDEAAQETLLYPGEEVVVELTTRATGTNAGGHFIPSLLVKHIPETQANLSDTVETA